MKPAVEERLRKMTTIYIYAGANNERDGNIMLASASLEGSDRREKPYSMAAAMAEAHGEIKRRNLADVAIEAHGKIVWADAVATERMYPEVGKPPAARRSGVPGSGNEMAASASVCPWNQGRYKIVAFA